MELCDYLVRIFDRHAGLVGVPRIEFGVFDILVTKVVHQLASRSAAFCQRFASSLIKAVRCRALW